MYFHSAHADSPTCTATGGASCKEVFAYGMNSPLYKVYYGPTYQGNVYMERTLRAFLYSGTGDHERYMLYVITVTLNPDINVRLANLVTTQSDTSVTGDNSTIQVRLWDTNVRSQNDCFFSGGTTCDQRNYSDLEQLNYCQANGGQQTLTAGKDLGNGVNIGWSLAVPTFNWCITSPPADVWSQYTNYTLQDGDQRWARITQQFAFAQWEPEGDCCSSQFNIGFSVRTKLMDAGSKVIVDGPASDNDSTFFTI